MIWYILFGIVCIVATVFIVYHFYTEMDIIMGLFLSCLLTLFVMVIISNTIVPMTTGLFENYAIGQREGYLTTVYVKGIIWKTNEAQIQVGTGELAALQDPFDFSIDNEKLLIDLKKAIGKKVRIKYLQWVILPYRKGESNYLLTDIAILKQE